ncbi:MAG: hypothetical protein ACRDYZ_03050 [Acidimicrobiales bacterium]
MLLVFISIPLMVLALAIATVPLIIAMRMEAMEQREALQAGARRVAAAPAEELPLAA